MQGFKAPTFIDCRAVRHPVSYDSMPAALAAHPAAQLGCAAGSCSSRAQEHELLIKQEKQQ